MRLTVNGEPREVPDEASVAQLLQTLEVRQGGAGVAVAVNGEVVPKGGWRERVLDPEDHVEVLGAIGGG